MLEGDNMTDRQRNILKLIIQDYIRTARPIGSNVISEELNLSSATIRNEMVVLEDLGLIEKTHTSSGRVPSEKGYRYYVDELMEPKELTGEEMLKLQAIFHNQTLQVSDAILKSVEIISELTNYTSVVLGKSSEDNALQKVEVLPLSEQQMVAIIITDKGHVEHKNIFLEEAIQVGEIKQTVELINKMLIGTPIPEVSAKLEFEVKPILGNYVKQYKSLYNAFYNAFAEFANKNNVLMLGRSNFLKQPEFSDVDKIRNIIDVFEDRDFVKSIEAKDNGIQIHIGKESNLDDDVAVINMKYHCGGEEGTIAFIGPKRMDYERIVTLLEYIEENIKR